MNLDDYLLPGTPAHKLVIDKVKQVFRENRTQIIEMINNNGAEAEEFIEWMCKLPLDDVRGLLRQLNLVSS